MGGEKRPRNGKCSYDALAATGQWPSGLEREHRQWGERRARVKAAEPKLWSGISLGRQRRSGRRGGRRAAGHCRWRRWERALATVRAPNLGEEQKDQSIGLVAVSNRQMDGEGERDGERAREREKIWRRGQGREPRSCSQRICRPREGKGKAKVTMAEGQAAGRIGCVGIDIPAASGV